MNFRCDESKPGNATASEYEQCRARKVDVGAPIRVTMRWSQLSGLEFESLGLLPSVARVTKVTVGGSLLVDRLLEIELLD
jgi:hypothetical protein